jgi:hypothetical protein
LIAISCALYAEAKPLIEKFNLSPLSKTEGLKIFGNEKCILQVTGIGRNSYESCRRLFARENQKISLFLNIGIAGHKDLKEGTLVLAHKVSFQPHLKYFYPIILFSGFEESREIITQEKIEDVFEKDSLYDMEAFFLFEAASSFLPFELIHSLKIISDGREKSSQKVTSKDIENLIAQKVEKISQIIDELIRLEKELAQLTKKEPPSPFFVKWHFTETEKHQLEDLLSRFKALSLLPPLTSLTRCQSGQEVLLSLNNFLRKELRSGPCSI